MLNTAEQMVSLQRAAAFVRRASVSSTLAGLLLKRHFRGRYVLWKGGLPMPKIQNRGGRLESGGITLFNGVRIEVGRGATLRIGRGTYINRGTTIICHERVEIGERCLVSWDVVIGDSNEHDWPGIGEQTAPVTIGDHVWIGCRSIILRGVSIGSGSVIGAGSVVTRSIPPGVLAAGQPARVIRSLPFEDVEAPAVEQDGDRLSGERERVDAARSQGS